jgi:hypothetical protein
MLPKVSPARFDTSYRLDNGIKGSSNFVQGPQGQGAQPHRFQRACKIRFKPKLLQNLRPPLSMFLSKACYTDVESNGRDAIQNPNQLPNVRPTGKTHAHAQMTVSLKPHAPKEQRFDILPQVGQCIQFVELRTGPRDKCTTHTRFQRACKIRSSTSRNPPKFATSPRCCSYLRFDLLY